MSSDSDLDKMICETEGISINGTRLYPCKYAYHVTNIETTERNSGRPPFSTLKRGFANDPTYDGLLVGLPCVFFATTLYRGDLPTSSPYPIAGKEGHFYKRIKIPLTLFKHYDFWRCEGIEKPQERLILTKQEERRFVENIKSIKRIDKTNNKYLCYKNGVWYTNDWEDRNFFCNFVVFGAFELPRCNANRRRPCTNNKHCSFDTVKRGFQDQGFPMSEELLLEELCKQWTAKHYAQQISNL